MITINIVCSPEQLADIQARVSALQADLYRLGVAFSVSTHHEPPPRSSMTLDEAQHDQEAVLRASSRRSTRSTSIPSWEPAIGSRRAKPVPEWVGVRARTMGRWIRSGRLRGRVTEGGQFMATREEVERLAAD